MDAPAPMPEEDFLIRVTLLGVVEDESDLICTGCEIPMLRAYFGYSVATEIRQIETGGYCEFCDTIHIGGTWEDCWDETDDPFS